MHIELVTEGGFAAIPGLARPLVIDDSSTLDGHASELEALVDAALAEQKSVAPALTPNLPDARQYHLVIERGGQRYNLCATDSVVPPAFKALMRFVRQHAVR
ncbi:MAG: protealysin inhibitor emfourin [Gammaproteobacteria bacterium]